MAKANLKAGYLEFDDSMNSKVATVCFFVQLQTHQIDLPSAHAVRSCPASAPHYPGLITPQIVVLRESQTHEQTNRLNLNALT